MSEPGATPEPAAGTAGAEATASAEARRRWLLLLGLAAAVRLAYLLEYTGLPFLRGPLGDSNVYLRQAQMVAAGHYGDATLLAFSPLYGYVLALLGGDAAPAVLLQLALGVAVTALLAREVGRRFGEHAGLAAGMLFLGYGLIVFYESKVLSDAIGLDLAALGLALYLRSGPRAAAAAGVTLGLAVLARSSLVFAAPLFVLAALVPRGSERAPAALRRAGLVAVGFAFVFGANAAWTHAHAGVAVPIIHASSDDNVVARSTRTSWSGDLGDVALDRDVAIPGPWDRVRSVERSLRERRRDDLGGALGSIDLGGWLRQAPGRIATTLSDTERSFQYGYYGERTSLRTLDLLPLSVPVLFLLGILGGALLAREEGWRAVAPYLPLVLGVLAVTTLYHPSSRYRLPMVLPLVWLGGLAAARLWAARRERWAQAAGALVLGVALVSAIRGWTYELANPAGWELSLAESYREQGDLEQATRHAERARALAPDDPHVDAVLRHIGLPR